MFVEIIRWSGEENIARTLGKMVLVLLILFFFGCVVTSIDNYAHLFGFVFGVFVALGFRPFTSLKGVPYSKGCLIFTRIMMFACAIGLFALLVVIFYMVPITSCSACMYFNCIPFTDTYCDGMEIAIERDGQAVTSDA
jgi:hypothetical protein